MRVKFVNAPTGGRHHKVGDVVDVAHDYAQKYIAKGWAVEHKEELSNPTHEKPLSSVKVQGGYVPAGGGDKPATPTTGSGVGKR